MMKNKYSDMFEKVKNSIEGSAKRILSLDNPLKLLQEMLEKEAVELQELLSKNPEDQNTQMKYNNAISTLTMVISQRKEIIESEIKNNKLYVDTLKIVAVNEKDEQLDKNGKTGFDFEAEKQRIKERNHS